MQLLQKNNKIKALQTQLRRKKKSDIPAITRETDTIEITPEEKKRKFIETISGKVVALVNEANVFRDEEPPTKKTLGFLSRRVYSYPISIPPAMSVKKRCHRFLVLLPSCGLVC